MASQLTIAHGNPPWASDAIRPSKDTVVGANSSPVVSAIKQSSTGVFVYVKVANTGDDDLGVCSCPRVGIWGKATFFGGFIAADPGSPQTQVNAGTTFTFGPGDDSITIPGFGTKSLGTTVTKKRAWAWSPDGSFFAYADSGASATGEDWNLRIFALKAIPEISAKAGDQLVNRNGLFAGPWSNAQFGWLGSRAVIAAGAAPAGGGGGVVYSLMCPMAPSSKRIFEDVLQGATVPDLQIVISPCEETIAFLPAFAGQAPSLWLISTTDASHKSRFKVNNTPMDIGIVGPAAQITTKAHTAKGVEVNTGATPTGTTNVLVDDPDCTFVGGGIIARVDRVRSSTLPNGNLGVMPIGTSSVFSLRKGETRWAQVPNVNGWANQGDEHWCLLAQAYTADGTRIPRPWNGQAASPPAFPGGLVNCAQRNITITT